MIGSSDVPRIMAGDGVKVALEKLGELPPEDFGDVVEVQIGNIVEPRILDAFEAKEGGPIVRAPDTMRHATHAWLGAHLDGIDAARRMVIEAKSVGWYNRREWGEPGTDEVPDRVLWQVQEQLAVAGCAIAKVPVCYINEHSLKELLTGRLPPIEVYVIEADEYLEDYIIERCGKLWRHVEARTLPEPETPRDVRLLYRKDSGAVIEATNYIATMHRHLLAQREIEANTHASIEHMQSQLQAFMKDASELRYEGKTLATWKKTKDQEAYTVAARAGVRKFLVKEPKT